MQRTTLNPPLKTHTCSHPFPIPPVFTKTLRTMTASTSSLRWAILASSIALTACGGAGGGIISTGGSHSGYRFFSARDHDWHHEHFNYCYGVGVFMDKLFRTEFIGTPAWEKAMRNNNNNNDDAHNLSAPPPPAAVASKKHE